MLETVSGSGGISVVAATGTNQAVINGKAIYRVSVTGFGEEMIITDGTAPGTSIVDINPGSAGSSFQIALSYNKDEPNEGILNGWLYFAATTAATGSELFRTNGTIVELFKDVRVGALAGLPSGFNIVSVQDEGVLFFMANDGLGNQVWKTNGLNGNSPNTVQLTTSADFIVVTAIGKLSPSEAKIIVIANATTTGVEPFLLDATSPTPVITLLADLTIGTLSSSYSAGSLSYRCGKAIWWGSATVGGVSTGTELFVSDGTPVGTKILKDIWPGTGSSLSSATAWLDEYEGRCIFIADHYLYSVEPWITDGTPEGTQLLRDFNTISLSAKIAYADSSFFYEKATLETGTDLWKTSGAPGDPGTLVKDLEPTNPFKFGSPFIGSYWKVAGDKLFFMATETATGSELWVSNGTDAGTFIPKEGNVGTANGVETSTTLFEALDNVVIYRGISGGTTNTEPWVSDGTTIGTFQLMDINTGNNGSAPQQGKRVGAYVYFLATTATGPSIWRTQGTVGTTEMVFSIANPLTITSYEVSDSGNIIYAGSSAAAGSEAYWVAAGTSTPVLLKDINPGSGSSTPSGFMFVSNNRAIFTANDSAATPTHLWTTNGTPAGTEALYQPSPVSGSSVALQVRGVVGGKACFFLSGTGIAEGGELWITDGTTLGTSVVDANPGPGSSQVLSFAVVNNKAYFKYRTDGDYYLWETDGTVLGTKKTADMAKTTNGSSFGTQITSTLSTKSWEYVNNRIYFWDLTEDNMQTLINY